MDKLNLNLEPRSIATCPQPSLPDPLLRAFGPGILHHQNEVYQAAATHDIILDLAPTGTGKTKAGLSVIAHNRDRSAIYIAPTNALIEQQAVAAETFLQAAGLPHVVKAASARQIKEWPDDRVGNRSGEKVYNVLREPATLFPDCAGQPLLLVTNPDIFYYATFFAYNQLDRSNIASAFYNSFATVIFDEFHLYDAKQLVGLLFYLALSHSFGYFRDQRKVVLLTATPEPACEVALKQLAQAGVKIYQVEGETQTGAMVPSQTAVNLEIRPQLPKQELIAAIAQEVLTKVQDKPDQFGAVILDSLDQVNQLNDALREAGLEEGCGRITGVVKSQAQRHGAAQKPVILATSTVDVGFNFERDQGSERQNLDWLIFSARDRFSFWQRLGRVGRVLGKSQTEIPSVAIAYLPEKAWEEGLASLDCGGGREALQRSLETLACMQRPFLEIYWKSEAFLEIARLLLELESVLHNLEAEPLIQELYTTLQQVLGGSRPWQHYKHRMLQITTAETLAKTPLKPRQSEWSFITVLFKQSPYIRHSFIKKFLELRYPEQWEAVKRQEISMEEIEKEIREYEDLAAEVQEFAVFWKTVWSPLFRFRESLFDSVTVHDPRQLLLDEAGETTIDPFHLLRFYEFVADETRVEVSARAKEPYQLRFTLLWAETISKFEATQLGKLWAYPNLSVKRTLGEGLRPTQFPLSLRKLLEENLIPGVIVKENSKNRWTICKLRKQGLECYPMEVEGCDSSTSTEYLFFPSLAGILAIAAAGVALQSPDNQEFWIA